MTTEELLKPRYKVIADWPDSNLEIGAILYRHDWTDNDTYCYVTNKDALILGQSMRPAQVENYPHLFKKLEWWEERKIEEMPEYMKWPIPNKGLQYGKVDRWQFHNGYYYWWTTTILGEEVRLDIEGDDFPATKEEYITFLKTN